MRYITPKFLYINNSLSLLEKLKYYINYKDITNAPKAKISIISAYTFYIIARVEKAKIIGILIRDIIN